jgi:CRISPR-associated protein Csx10
MKLYIKLLSDMCTYSGETYNSMVDTDIVYDVHGIPYIPAKRIKGCIRETALELLEFGLISREKYEKLFGKEGNQQSEFSLSNAYLKEHAALVAVAEHLKKNGLAAPQNVLDQYTDVRTQTAVDLETGVADKNSLRTMRVIRRGLEFEAECNPGKNVDAELQKLLELAVSLVKHMGVSRSRGLGLVEMKLDNIGEMDSKETNKHVFITKEQLKEKNKINYRITLKSAMVCKSPQGNQAQTQDYIAGSKVLGLLAGALGREAYLDLMENHGIRVSNAYIMNGEKRCMPARLSMQKQKDQSYDDEGKMLIKDMLYDPDVTGKQMTPAGVAYMDADRHTASVVTEISYHHQRTADKSVGRATGEDGSGFYQLCGISAGQTFGGSIYADKVCAEKILEAVNVLGEVRMGYGKSSEFGAVDFVLYDVEPFDEQSQSMMHDAVLTLGSDVILYNEYGMPSTEINVLKNCLEAVTGVDDLELTHPFLDFALIGGFNVTWQRRKPEFHALGKGSAFLVHSDKGFDAERLRSQFIGERTAEGYGELILTPAEASADVCIYKRTDDTLENAEEAIRNKLIAGEETGRILQQLLQTEFARQMEESVRNRLKAALEENQDMFTEKEEKTQKRVVKRGLNASVAKLRAIFKNETSYQAMKDQADAIEDGKKREICQDVLTLVDPKQLAAEVSEKINQFYQVPFTNQWGENTLYKNIYRIYLTELKYLVKSLNKAEKKG